MSNKVSPLVLWSRSHAVCDWLCPRKRYLNYEVDGKGIVKGSTSLALFTGTTIHDALSAIAYAQKLGKPIDIDELATIANQQMFASLIEAAKAEVDGENFAKEQAALVEGLIRGFYRQVWPRLMVAYPNILLIEEELSYEHDGGVFMSKPDLVLADEQGEAVYVEYKSTKSKREEWVNSWDTAVQLHSTVRAIKASAGIDVSTVIVQALYKGFESYGKQNSPFCYAYHRSGNPPFTMSDTIYTYKAGYKRAPTWELPGGVKQWVENMPEDLLSDQFLQTPPIFVNDDLITAFFRQQGMREYEIAEAAQQLALPSNGSDDDRFTRLELLDRVFPQKFDQCNPGYGWPCEYRQICHGNVPNPLEAGYSYRTPHHEAELAQDIGEGN